MEKQQVYIGSIRASSGGLTLDSTKKVAFTGELIGHYSEPGIGTNNALTDTRGVYQKLYRLDDGRLLAHVEHWSHWAGEETAATLHLVTKADLQPGGRFTRLGDASGYGRPLTLDEALAPVDDWTDLPGAVIITTPEALAEAADLQA